ncbi:hypothetical protein NYE24_18160 [Paenibacillus sp. FSL H7-0350]
MQVISSSASYVYIITIRPGSHTLGGWCGVKGDGGWREARGKLE